MSAWKARRFWKTAHAVADESGQGWRVQLDERLLATPGGLALILPSAALAQEIVAEWAGQPEIIDPSVMPLTRAANTAVERVAPRPDAVIDELASYGETDLLCYRAASPQDLRARQDAAWDPLLAWAAHELGAPLKVTTGVLPIAQDPHVLAALRARIAALDAFALTALHDLVTLSGSLVIGLAALHGAVDADTALTAQRIDEDFQAAQWGRDEEAEERRDARAAAFRQALRFYDLSRAA